MPLVTFTYAYLLELQSHHAIGMIIVASCPGGTVSNIFTYWSRGDLPLSVSMTLVSTVLALGFMPLNMFIYLRYWTDTRANIPFPQIAGIIALTWVPVICGMIIQQFSKNVARYFVRLGSIAGMSLILIAGIMQGRMSPSFFYFDPIILISGFCLPFIGFIIGYIVAFVSCMTVKQKRTIALETGIQNTGIALTLITLTFNLREASDFSQTPMLFAAGQIFLGALVPMIWIVLDNGFFLGRVS
ncbi:hypothetical protein CAPTEDRAFT_4790 [Capitella teleta]|uniref:Uncharacterized protein n=1 Tax=Capitella teleta TaxID=283909 RepID=R7VBU8_CAPTE|nr:hypothetical protein CAPTEDRAFT_4790 [Capitella teleta]|eukprot:ELU16037.1 hypothetical protein CAPTEDRAFT_4790 [Capitella teleta]